MKQSFKWYKPNNSQKEKNVTKVEIAHLETFLDLEKNVHEGTFYILKHSSLNVKNQTSFSKGGRLMHEKW